MSSEKSEDDDNEVISKQILDYYKKYSQNKQLPKYFTGTSLSYMPPIVKESDIEKAPIITIEESNPEVSENQDEQSEPKTISPTSSVTSGRKLEWDSGADIGYNNCSKITNLHKSTSLPILLNSLEKKSEISIAKKLSSQVVTAISYSSSESEIEQRPVQVSASSTNTAPSVKKYPTTSTSTGASVKKYSSSSSYETSLQYLTAKIGLPDAASTPKLRSVKLCATKPIVVECLDLDKRKGSDKKIQTFADLVSKSIQTGDSLGDKSPSPVQHITNQSLIHINYDTSSEKKSCSNTQTDDDVIASHCDSFEYYKECPVSRSESSKDLPVLGQIISEKQSNSLIADVDRSIELLQKLLKSKKYDASTKKRYVKKIVDKIVNGKYPEDSTSSSDLFVPKRRKHGPPLSKFTVQVFSDEFFPQDAQNESNKKSPFTVTQNTSPESQNLTSGSYKSWKENKTVSEKNYEGSQKGQGDQLVKFAKKERRHQLEWINDEISHLTKLKNLLENTHKTTTVYMVNQHFDKCDRNSCMCSNSASNSSRNYVIHTELSSSGSSLPKSYNFSDKNGKTNYRITELTAKPEDMNISKHVIGDIDVVSDNKITNITVKARNLDDANKIKLKPPILSGKFDTFPRSKTEEICWPCGRQKPGPFGPKPIFEESNSQNKISEKIKEIIHRYGSGPSTSHCCTCTDVLNTNLKSQEKVICCKCNENAITFQVDLQKSSSCHCCRRNSANTQTKDCRSRCSNKQVNTFTCGRQISDKCQTDGCNCCNKEVNTFSCGRLVIGNCQTDDCNCCNKEVNTCNIECRGTENARCQTEGCNCCNKETTTVSCLKTGDVRCQTEDCDCCGKNTEHVRCQTEDCSCCNKGVCTDLPSKYELESSTSSSSCECDTETVSCETPKSCICCKRKNVTTRHLNCLRRQLSDQAYPLCRPCYRQNRRGVYGANYYSNPGHVCNCYTVVQTKTLNEIKKTINDLNNLDEYCTCTTTDNRSNSSYCKYCKCKLKSTLKNKNSIAYMLTFEDTSLKEKKKKRKKKPYLEEIKIKIPVPHKKKHKDKENKRKKKTCDSEDTSTSGKRSESYNLQGYLKKNRPAFVQFADDRRNTVNENRKQREDLSDFNKLVFLQKCKEEFEKNSKSLFSAKEMKEITKRNYKRLPEVQQKMNDNKQKQLRQASRLMANAFNKKLRENVLKGKRDLPTDVKVVDM